MKSSCLPANKIRVYKITNLLNGMIYIGLTNQTLKRRFAGHKNAKTPLGKDIRKFGVSVFHIKLISTNHSLKKSNKIECSLIKEYNCLIPNGYNQEAGGGFRGRSIQFLPFKDARSFVRSLHLRNKKEWAEFCRSGKKPDNIPTCPEWVYQSEWTNLGNFLGTGTIATQQRTYLSYAEAKTFVVTLGLKSMDEWLSYCRSSKKPDNIPAAPEKVYKNQSWAGYGDFLGTNFISLQKRTFLPFEEAKEFVRSLGLKTQKEWLKYCALGLRPINIPAHPQQTYKNDGWFGYGDWLGNNYTHRNFLPYEEAKSFVAKLHITSTRDWRKYSKSEDKPDNIPTAPWRTYKGNGWIGIADWIGLSK